MDKWTGGHDFWRNAGLFWSGDYVTYSVEHFVSIMGYGLGESFEYNGRLVGGCIRWLHF